MKLDHATIRTKDLNGTKNFLLNVFDLEEKPRPKIIQRIPGHWLYHKNEPIIHLIQSYGNPLDYTTEGFDHIGIKLKNYDKFKQKLKQLNIPYSLMDIEEISERRIFFRTPENVLFEVVFQENINKNK